LKGGQAEPLAVSKPVGSVESLKKDNEGRIWVLNSDGHLIIETWSPTAHTFTVESDADFSARDGSSLASLALLNAGDLFAFGTSQGRLVLVQPPGRGTRGTRISLDAHRDRLSAVAFSPNGELLATAGWDGQILLWDVESRRQLGEPLNSGGLGISGLAFSKDGRWLAVASDNRTLILYPATPEQWVKAACATAGRSLTPDELDRFLIGKAPRACSP
jgi:WD40 repeat protein